MSHQRKRASSDRGTESENESEGEEEETTSKATRGTNGGVSALGKRPRKNTKKEEDVVDMCSAVSLWSTSLKGPYLDLMVSLKELAEVRLVNTGEKCLSCCLTPASLRTIGIILEEFIKDRMTMNPPTDIGLLKGYGNPQVQQGGEGSLQSGREE